MTKVLVTGGAGYIGTHVVMELIDAGYEVVVIDKKINDKLRKWLPEENLIKDDFVNATVYDLSRFNAVIHLAASHQVEESCRRPFEYYENNITKTIQFLEDLQAAKVNNFIFSGSSSVFGNNCSICSNEQTEHDPLNPYATSKSVVESILNDMNRCFGFRSVTLRYFNAAGADPLGNYGYVQEPPAHLVPIVCKAVLDNKPIEIYGTDYANSTDGTCVRDYTHVSDLAKAHVLALKYMLSGGQCTSFNLGQGKGASVRHVIAAVGNAAGVTPIVIEGNRRVGDADKLVADITRARTVLGWEPTYSINDIAQHALAWEKSQRT